MRIKPVMRLDTSWPKFRLARLMWERGTVGDGIGYSAKLAVALRPRLFQVKRSYDGWRVVVLGLELHMARSWGGTFS